MLEAYSGGRSHQLERSASVGYTAHCFARQSDIQQQLSLPLDHTPQLLQQ